MRSFTFLAASLAVAAATDEAFAKKPRDTRAPLVRPATPPDADARGRVEMREQKGEGRFELKAFDLDGAGPFEAFLETAVGGGTFASIGTLDADQGEWKLRLDEDEEGLPLGVASVDDLVERLVRIESGAQVFLEGVVPDFPDGPGQKGGAWERGKVAATRPFVGPPDEDAKGTVEVRTKSKDHRDRFTVKAERLPTNARDFHLFVEDGVDSEVFVDLGSLDEDGDEVRFHVDTWSGEPLPLGVLDVEELAGRVVEIRGDDLATYLRATVPAFHEGKKKATSKGTLSGAGGSANVTAERHAVAPYERLSIAIQTSILGGSVDLYVADPATGTPALVRTLATIGSGKASYDVRTKNGEPLPFGASLEELDGAAIEVRDEGGGTLMAGTLDAP